MEVPFTPTGSVEPVAIIGGTGSLGLALASRLTEAGVSVVVGSRHPTSQGEHDHPWKILSNTDAAHTASLTVLAIPQASYAELLPPLSGALIGKIVLSTAVPFPYPAGAHASAAEEAAALLPDALIVAGLHTISSAALQNTLPLNQDTILTGDDPAAIQTVQALLQRIAGLRPILGGRLANSRYTEAATHLLIGINKHYHRSCGLRIVPLTDDDVANR